MENSSDDWCYVDMEPELELEPMCVEEPISASKAMRTKAMESQEVDVTSFLCDSTTQTTDGSREFRVSLLSPSHQRYIITGKTTQPKSIARKRSVQQAFTSPSRRVYAGSSYVHRFRAAMPSRRELVSSETSSREETRVKPFTIDQGTQTDVEEAATTDRLTELSSALERSLRLSMQLKNKSHDAERLDVRGMLLQNRVEDLEQENQNVKRQLRAAARGLRLSQKRSELAKEYQDHLKREREQLRMENDNLHQRIEVLAGGLDVEAKSILELEQLEDALEKAMAKIRRALRVKYHTAVGVIASPSHPVVAPKTPDVGCVVCMERLPCVRLEPCGHEVLCSECSLRVTTCPVDRQHIHDKVLTHGLSVYTSDKSK